jgi:hypothetical protein
VVKALKNENCKMKIANRRIGEANLKFCSFQSCSSRRTSKGSPSPVATAPGSDTLAALVSLMYHRFPAKEEFK